MTTLKTSVLDSIIFDYENKSEIIRDLKENPETFINPCFSKSIDEMTSKEAKKAFDEVKSYIKSNI